MRDGEFKSAVVDLFLLNSNVSPRVIIAVDEVFDGVKVAVALEWSINLQLTIRSLPDGKVSISEVLLVSTLSHVDNALPRVIFSSPAEDINAGAENSITIDGSDLSAVLRSDAATVDEGIAVVLTFAWVDRLAWLWFGESLMEKVSDSESSSGVMEVIGDVDEEIASEGINSIDNFSGENFTIDGKCQFKGVCCIRVSLLDNVGVPIARSAAREAADHVFGAVYEGSVELHSTVRARKEGEISVPKDISAGAGVHVDDVLPIIGCFATLNFSGDFEGS